MTFSASFVKKINQIKLKCASPSDQPDENYHFQLQLIHCSLLQMELLLDKFGDHLGRCHRGSPVSRPGCIVRFMQRETIDMVYSRLQFKRTTIGSLVKLLA